MISRKIEDLASDLQILFHEFSMRMHDEGLQFIVTCTYRSQDDQDVLYAKGRTTKGPIVTWTRNSRHTQRRAFDIAMLDDNDRITWKADDYKRAGEVGKSVGLEWLGPKDSCHFQLRG